MIYGFEFDEDKSSRKVRNEDDLTKNREKLPHVRDIVVLDRRRLDSTEGTLIP